MKLFIAPHNDDAVLFGTFTLLREQPHVVVVLDSYIQASRGNPNCTKEVRRREDSTAVIGTLDCCNLDFLGYRDDRPDWDGIRGELQSKYTHRNVELVYAPWPELGGHDHHNAIGNIAGHLWKERIKYYTTYTNRGKSKGAVRVPYQPEWVVRKLRAMACYESQICLENCCEHFMRDQFEYYAI